MTTDNFGFYLPNTQIQTVKQEVNGTVILPSLVFPAKRNLYNCIIFVSLKSVLFTFSELPSIVLYINMISSIHYIMVTLEVYPIEEGTLRAPFG
jgi:hypothetical protein